jgi:allantoicase
VSNDMKSWNGTKFTQIELNEIIGKLREHYDDIRVDYYRNGAVKRIRVYGSKDNDE